MRFAITAAAALLAMSNTLGWAAPPSDFPETVEELRRKVGAPGVSIAIVEDGAVTLARGWGIREMGKSDAVDADTLFQTGSTGKAITAAALAILVDEGRISWDDPVIKHMPWFRMYDPWVTREITVRDLLVHRGGLGLGQGDLMLFPRSNLSRREVVERVAYLKPQTSFRSAYAYSNILYVVAGQLIEDVSGMTWEDFVRERVLRPGGMKTATTRTTERVASANRSLPHARVSGLVRGLGPQHVLDENDGIAPNAGPAGGLAFSAKDQATWLQILLAGGTLPDGSILFSEVQAAELWKPVTVIPIGQLPESLKLAQPSYQAYALGWQVRDYRGHRMLTHSGSVSGAIARVVLLPDIKVGFAIQMNSEDSGMLLGLTYELLDHYLGLPEIGWIDKWQSSYESSLEAGHRELIKAQAKPARTRPSLSLARYTGRYRDPWYGDVVIGSDRHGLTVDFTTTPGMAGRLTHWQYDTFITEFNDVTLERAYVTFVLDAEGKVASMAMKPVNPIVDFSWDYQDLELRPVEYAR